MKHLEQAAGWLKDDSAIYQIRFSLTAVFLEALAAAQADLSDPSTRTDYALAADPGDDAAGESESYNET